MSSSKYYRKRLKLKKLSMTNDPPLFFHEASGFLRKTDMFSSMLYRGSSAVVVYSSRPYDEFYKSMVEMVISRLEHDLSVDWDYMEELLLCYLKLNEKKVHKYVMRAFLDVMEIMNVELEEFT